MGRIPLVYIYPMIRNNASGPEIKLLGRISVEFSSVKPQPALGRPKADWEALSRLEPGRNRPET